MLWTNGSVPFPFGKGGFGVLANWYLYGTEATLSFSAGSVCLSFFAETCAILQAICWSRQHQQVCHFFAFLLLSDTCPVLATLSSPLSFLLSQTLWHIWQELFSVLLYYQATMGPRTLVFPGNDAADESARRGALLAPSAIPCNLSLIISHIHSCLFSEWRRTLSSIFFVTQVSSISPEELALPRHARCVLSRTRCNGHSLLLSFYLSSICRIENASCSTCGHSTEDTSHLTRHLISFCTVQPPTLCAARFLNTLCLSLSLRPLVQALGSFLVSGAPWSSAMPPSLGRGLATTTTTTTYNTYALTTIF